MNFNFNTRAYHILLKILDKVDIKEVFASYENTANKIQASESQKIDIYYMFDMIDIVNIVIKALIMTERESIELMSIVLDKTIDEVANMPAVEYIRYRKEFIKSIDWSELMGEHLEIIPMSSDSEIEQQSKKD